MGSKLTTGGIVSITGILGREFKYWLEQGIIAPVEGGKGQGNHCKFSVMQAVGIGVANALRQTDRGCVLPYVGQIVTAFEKLSEERLEELFDENRTHFAALVGQPLHPILQPGEFPDQVDVQDIYRRVTNHVRMNTRKGRIVSSSKH